MSEIERKVYKTRRRMVLASGYSEAGASTVRRALKGFRAISASPFMDIDFNNRTLRQRGRILFMSAPVATSAIVTNRSKVVGTGLTLKSAIDREFLGMSPEASKKWQSETEHEFRMWASKKENCDATGINNFDGIQQLAIMSWLMSGDCFAIFKRYDPSPTCPYSLRIHLVEADRVSTPHAYGAAMPVHITEGINKNNKNPIHDGVEVDKHGRILAYHVCNVYPNQMSTQPAEWTRVTA